MITITLPVWLFVLISIVLLLFIVLGLMSLAVKYLQYKVDKLKYPRNRVKVVKK